MGIFDRDCKNGACSSVVKVANPEQYEPKPRKKNYIPSNPPTKKKTPNSEK